MNINFSFFSGSGKIRAQKKALEAARVALLAVAGVKCVHEKGGMPYCDFCPCSAIGRLRDKTGIDHDDEDLICTKSKDYSK